MRRVIAYAAACLALGCDRPAQSPAADDVPATVVRRYSCPTDVPAAWTAADSSLGSGPRCTLVAAAAAAIAASARGDSTLAGVSLARATCVRAERVTLLDPSQRWVVADTWLVAFYSDSQPDAVAAIHVGTGAAHGFVSPRDVRATAQEMCAPAT
jgi:hypothetical protein